MTTLHNEHTGRRWAYTGILLGGAVSVAANVAHSFVPPTGAPPTWRPHANTTRTTEAIPKPSPTEPVLSAGHARGDQPATPTAQPPPVAVPAHLIPTARFAVTNHEVTTGLPITADQLAARMSVSAAVAEQLLAQLRDDTTPAALPARVNGTHVLQEVTQ